MGDAILRIPRDERVRAYRTRDTYDGVVPVTSKRQPYCHSSYIELSGSIHIDWVFHSRLALIYEYLLRALLVLFKSADSVIMFGGLG